MKLRVYPNIKASFIGFIWRFTDFFTKCKIIIHS